MKVKTKNKIKRVFVRLGDLFVIAMIFFVFWLAVGTYGAMKGDQRYRQGFFDGINNVKPKPPIKTSFTLPSGDTEKANPYLIIGYRN